MSRWAHCTAALVALLPLSCPLLAQGLPAGDAASPPERIDLTISAPPRRAADDEACRRENEAALISGAIVVCGNRGGAQDQRITSRSEAQDRYAAATQGGTTPDVAGAGIFRGPATFGGVCIRGVLNCPAPPALIVDVRALPTAPPGSDADRISRGLPPRGDRAEGPQRPISTAERAELGLPPDLAGPLSPEGSAEPAAPR